MIKLKDKKVIVILIVIAGLVLVAVSGFFLNSYLVQQSTLKELDRASQSLESVYDKLTEINRDNLASSSFTKDCSAPNRGPYDRIISCSVCCMKRNLAQIKDLKNVGITHLILNGYTKKIKTFYRVL